MILIVISTIDYIIQASLKLILYIICSCFIGAYLRSSFEIRRKKAFFTKHGIYGPTPSPMDGNNDDLISKSRIKLEKLWRDKYGKVYVTFVREKPHLTITDPQIVRDICITNFKHFVNSKFTENTPRFDKNTLFHLKNDRWLKVRSIMTPSFTSGKIKKMFKLLHSVSDDLVDSIKKSSSDSNDNFPTYAQESNMVSNQSNKTKVSDDIYHLYSLKGIANCVFSIDIDRKGSTIIKDIRKANKFVDACVELNYFPFWAQVFGTTLSDSFLSIFTNYYEERYNMFLYLKYQIKSIIEHRASKNSQHNDILSDLYNARLGDKLEFVNNVEKDIESHHEGYNENESLEQVHNDMLTSLADNESANSQLTNNELYANSIYMLLAGTSLPAEVLRSAVYVIAHHNDMQKRLYDEISLLKKFDETGESYFDYEGLVSNEYLDAFVSETLRLFSPVLGLNRECSEDYLLKDYNYLIKKNDMINISVYALQTHPDYWPEPEKFDPERFMPGNKEKIVPGSYCPFGLGPRQCIGTRFALIQLKLAIARLVTEFEFSPVEGLHYPPAEGDTRYTRKLGDQSVYAKYRHVEN